MINNLKKILIIFKKDQRKNYKEIQMMKYKNQFLIRKNKISYLNK